MSLKSLHPFGSHPAPGIHSPTWSFGNSDLTHRRDCSYRVCRFHRLRLRKWVRPYHLPLRLLLRRCSSFHRHRRRRLLGSGPAGRRSPSDPPGGYSRRCCYPSSPPATGPNRWTPSRKYTGSVRLPPQLGRNHPATAENEFIGIIFYLTGIK